MRPRSKTDRSARRDKSARSVFGKSLVIAVAVIEIVVWLFLADPLDRRLQAIDPEDPEPNLVSKSYVNEEGHFSFEYPQGWSVRDIGTSSKVMNRPRDAVVALARQPRQDVLELRDDIVAVMEESYDDVAVKSHDVEATGDGVRLEVFGSARNEFGTPLRFLAVALEGRSKTYVATGFTVAGPSAATRFDRLVAVARSLRCVSDKSQDC